MKRAGLTDREIVSMARDENRIIVTLDLDFGELYHETAKPPQFGIIILRLLDQRVGAVNSALKRK